MIAEMSVLMSWLFVGLMAWFLVSVFFLVVTYIGNKPWPKGRR